MKSFQLFMNALLLCTTMTATACVAPEDEQASTEQDISAGWTPSTSEELPPVFCDGSSLVAAAQCTGRFCDNVSLFCKQTQTAAGVPVQRGVSSATPFFSDEGGGQQICVTGSWVTGMQCTGRFCDNVSLTCTEFTNVNAINCHWTGPVSEENGGTLDFGAGFYARGAKCTGSFCDNMSYFVCQI
jgi:hypothetical protein